MDFEFINYNVNWMLPMFAALALILCLVLIYRLGRQRDKLFQERNAIYDFVHDVSEAFVKSDETHIDFLLKRVLFYAQRTSMAGAGAIYFADSEGDELRVRAVAGAFPPIIGGFDKGFNSASSKFNYARDLVNEQRAVRGRGLVGEIAERGIPVLIEDAERDPRVPSFEDELFRIHSILLVPMHFHDTIMGVLVVINRIDDTPFIQSDLSLLQALADQASITIYFARFSEELDQKRLLDYDLRVAKKIQSSLLPRTLPRINGLELAAFSIPAREVGGDYYDFAHIDKDHLGLLVSDVSGKGVTGAIVMSICRSVFRANARNSLSPAHVLKAINDVISRDTYEDMFISMLYLVLNIRTFEIKIARAGHTQPFIISSDGGELRKISARGIAMGLADNDTFNSELEETTVRLGPGEVFAAYTDGLFEIPDNRQKKWSLTEFQELVRNNTTSGSRRIVERVRREILAFAADMPQYDDITLVVMNRHSEENIRIHETA